MSVDPSEQFVAGDGCGFEEMISDKEIFRPSLACCFGLLVKGVDNLPVKLEVSAVGRSRFDPRRECCWAVAEEALFEQLLLFP